MKAVMESNPKSGMSFFLFPEPGKGYFEEQKTVDFDGNVCFCFSSFTKGCLLMYFHLCAGIFCYEAVDTNCLLQKK